MLEQIISRCYAWVASLFVPAVSDCQISSNIYQSVCQSRNAIYRFNPLETASARQIKTKYESTSLFWKHLKTTRNIFFVADQKTRLQKKTAHLNAMVAQPLLTCHPRACIARKRSGYQRSPAITSGPGEPWWVVTQAWHPRIWVTLEETHGKQLFVWVATVLSVSLSHSLSLSESFFCSFSLSLSFFSLWELSW